MGGRGHQWGGRPCGVLSVGGGGRPWEGRVHQCGSGGGRLWAVVVIRVCEVVVGVVCGCSWSCVGVLIIHVGGCRLRVLVMVVLLVLSLVVLACGRSLRKKSPLMWHAHKLCVPRQRLWWRRLLSTTTTVMVVIAVDVVVVVDIVILVGVAVVIGCGRVVVVGGGS